MPKRIPYNKPVSAQYVRTLRAKAKLGDASAYDELVKRNKALARKANSALSKLEKSGFTRYAYDRAVSYTQSEYGMSRFTTSKNKLKDAADLQINIQEMSKFLTSKSSTTEGNIEIDRSIVNAFRNKGVVIPKGMENDFLDFIASDDFEQLKKCHVDSGVAIMDMVRLTGEYGVDIQDVIKAFKKVVDGTEYYNKALDELGYKI